jgi:hypothetical protein
MVCLAAICWAMWKSRNAIYFEKKIIRSPTEIICLAASFMSYWAGLQKGGDKEAPEMGAGALKEAALAFHPQVQARDDQGDGALMLQ